MFFRAYGAAFWLLALLSSAQANAAEGVKLLDGGDIPGSVKQFEAGFEAGEANGAFYRGRLFEIGIGTNQDMGRAGGTAQDLVR
ncbi:hypothetical protein M0412_20110 [Agrobacterium sp. O3.4]|uniref:Porin n=2 Tax=Rhizobium/Agrobacterium group TaxID=227290 RepID=A0A546XCM9_RHIRH|nr:MULTISPECIES: hypothetical protein [Rhizobium/Agrobacterium group]MCZ7471010.1 hypothetical protein [Rhizobium rhizogenes]TRA98480.1 hypothetical protein EXN68_20450 [Rhizobium rhizogenes]WHO10767.1 hypothetical protein KZ699_19985 [Agrobacterium cucumeris]